MSTTSRRVLATLASAAILAASPVLAGAATAASGPAGTALLQQQVNGYVAAHPGTHQISANKVAIPGGSVTLAAPGNSEASAALACANGHLCIQDGTGDVYDYYYCGYYSFDGIGDGTFNNNQTSGTTARFYNSNGSLRWYNTAKDTGTASWTPVYYIRPC
ncbi:hypothetical protein ACIQU5_35300 [Streptomyces sp. NPDC090306]|uniref:hypothetical protein n=1 Tax=Streptomyces sp. NPDC090306 TaxID=3365961 RepID=UPI00381A7F8B